MRVIVATDIHGISPQFRSMIEPTVGKAVFLSLWDTETCPYADEHKAVSAFISQNGIERYAAKISAAANGEPAYIVGFSVSASAAWLYSVSDDCNPKSTATLFYGSRIRDYSSLVPQITVTAVFAEKEPSFSPQQLARTIAGDNVRTFVELGTAHGFMNPLSASFAPAQCATHLQKLAPALQQSRFRVRR